MFLNLNLFLLILFVVGSFQFQATINDSSIFTKVTADSIWDAANRMKNYKFGNFSKNYSMSSLTLINVTWKGIEYNNVSNIDIKNSAITINSGKNSKILLNATVVYNYLFIFFKKAITIEISIDSFFLNMTEPNEIKCNIEEKNFHASKIDKINPFFEMLGGSKKVKKLINSNINLFTNSLNNYICIYWHNWFIVSFDGLSYSIQSFINSNTYHFICLKFSQALNDFGVITIYNHFSTKLQSIQNSKVALHEINFGNANNEISRKIIIQNKDIIDLISLLYVNINITINNDSLPLEEITRLDTLSFLKLIPDFSIKIGEVNPIEFTFVIRLVNLLYSNNSIICQVSSDFNFTSLNEVIISGNLSYNISLEPKVNLNENTVNFTLISKNFSYINHSIYYSPYQYISRNLQNFLIDLLKILENKIYGKSIFGDGISLLKNVENFSSNKINSTQENTVIELIKV